MKKKSAQLDNVTTAIKIEAISSVVPRMINYESCNEKNVEARRADNERRKKKMFFKKLWAKTQASKFFTVFSETKHQSKNVLEEEKWGEIKKLLWCDK